MTFFLWVCLCFAVAYLAFAIHMAVRASGGWFRALVGPLWIAIDFIFEKLALWLSK